MLRRALVARHLEHAPGGAPLPRRVAGALAEAGVGLPLVGDPVLDEVLVFPAVLHDHPLDGHVHRRVGAGVDLQMQPAVGLGVGDAGGAPRVDHDDLGLVAVDALQVPVVPDRCLALEGIGAGHEHAIGQREVLVRCAEDVVADIHPPRHRVDHGRMVVLGDGRRTDAVQRELGQRVGILEVLVAVVLHGPGALAVLLDGVLGKLGRDVQREVPGHRHENVVDAHQGVLQSVLGRSSGIVDLLRDAAAANAVPAADVDDLGLMVADDGEVVQPTLVESLGVLVGPDPAALVRCQWIVETERILILLRATVRRSHRPAVDLVAAGHDAVVAAGGQHVRVLRRQRYLVLGLIEGRRVSRFVTHSHFQSPLMISNCRSGRR